MIDDDTTLPEQEREGAQAARELPDVERDEEQAVDAAEATEEPVDAEVVPDEPEPAPELHEAVQEALAGSEMVVADPADRHEGMIAMDAKDAARFVDGVVAQAQQANLGKRWVYQLPYGGGDGLTIDAVQDITQQMNWTGRCSISLMPETLSTEVVVADEGYGDEPFWVATISAIDHKTGQIHVGSSMEPQKMRLKPETAKGKRKAGAVIGEDNKIFDRFARTKAIGKASRNAMEAHIPEVVKLTLIAMAKKKPEMIERIQTDAEAKVAELPPPLDTPEAKELTGKIEAVYSEIRELGGGRGKVVFTPGQFAAYLLQAQHDLALLERMLDYVTQRREDIAAQFAEASS